jgi:shikimate kinase/3-dehydroquinate synthase
VPASSVDDSAGHVWLVGMMGVGKTTLGAHLARRLGRPFIDLDRRIEELAGSTVADLFAADGEAGFRARETAVLRTVAAAGQPAAVVATGGGALCGSGAFEAMDESGLVVWLRADVDEVFAHPGLSDRPLLRGADPRTRWLTLQAERLAGYARAAAVVVRAGRSVDALGEELLARLAALGPAPLPAPRVPATWVELGERTYPVHLDVAPGSEVRFATHVARRFPPARTALAIVTDDAVARLHLPRYQTALSSRGFWPCTVVVPDGERAKTLGEAERVADQLVEAGLDRGGVILALGGGAVCDLAGFVAATLHRGVALVTVPTTLLAMVDASVGGKNGVNLAAGKNLLGVIHQPRLVWADLATLATLGERDLRAGLGEVVKHALLGGEPALAALEAAADLARAGDAQTLAALVRSSVRLKAEVVASDEREMDERGGRTLLNLGHTVGHALEAESLATDAPLRHGEAVALGLRAAVRVGASLGGLGDLEARLCQLLSRLGLPTDVDAALARLPGALDRLTSDKKRRGAALRYVALLAPAQAAVVHLEPARLAALLSRPRPSEIGFAPEASP